MAKSPKLWTPRTGGFGVGPILFVIAILTVVGIMMRSCLDQAAK